MSGVLIAIDGPSGSGKSTVAKLVARQLGVGYLDTGAMYRALTWLALAQGQDLQDEQGVRRLADRLALTMPVSDGTQRVLVGDTDITQQIRESRISENVALVARNLHVRAWMAEEQRRQMLAAREEGTGMVAEGRDITTVVCPEADVRVLLLADEEARLRRRALELHGDVTEDSLAATRVQIVDRDRSDATVSEFFTPAEGVTLIDSSDLSIGDVVERVLALVPDRRPA